MREISEREFLQNEQKRITEAVGLIYSSGEHTSGIARECRLDKWTVLRAIKRASAKERCH